MTKRIMALFLAVILPVMLLCGCAGGKALTVREYGEELSRCWSEFSIATADWTKYAPENFPYSGSDIEGLKETVSRREKALDDIAKINPPEKFAERHKELVRSLDHEYEWNKAALKLADAENNEEADKFGDEIAQIANSIPDGESFPSVYMYLYKDIRAELNG